MQSRVLTRLLNQSIVQVVSLKNRRTSTNEVNEVRLFRYLGNFLRIHLNNPNLSRVVIPNFLLFVFQNLEHKKSAPYFHVLDFCLRGSLNSRGI